MVKFYNPRRLKELGILGMNSRNLDYIFPYNNRKNYWKVDDKLETKKLAVEAGVPVPELFAVIESQQELNRLDEVLKPFSDFVIKPSQGSGGGGIMVIAKRNAVGFMRANGQLMSLDDLRYHISNILSGLYALGGVRDKALIERRIKQADLFQDMAYRGVPDIRLVVYRGVPVMAMLRLPTYASDGRANLHAGGIGVGVCMQRGRTTHSIAFNRYIELHTDTGVPLTGLTIPDWRDMLIMAARCQEMVGLGFVGVDIVLDQDHGPMLLEINARPGISIQIANGCGIKGRLEAVDVQIDSLKSMEQKVDFAMKHFAAVNVSAE